MRFSGQVRTQSTSNDFKYSIQGNLSEQASTVQPGPLPNVVYDSDSSKCHGRTDSRGCLKFVERNQPNHWPNSFDFLLGRTTAVISLSSLMFSTGMRKTLLEPVSLLCEGFIHGYRTVKGAASVKSRHRARSIARSCRLLFSLRIKGKITHDLDRLLAMKALCDAL